MAEYEQCNIQVNPTRVLDAAFNVTPDGSVTAKVFQKPEKLPAFWNSQILKRYKMNKNGDLIESLKLLLIFMKKFLS